MILSNSISSIVFDNALQPPVTFFVGENGIQRVEYQDTEHFQVTKSFLDHPERMLGYLFHDNNESY